MLAECILTLFRGADPDDPDDEIRQQIGALRIAEFLNISIASKTQKPKR